MLATQRNYVLQANLAVLGRCDTPSPITSHGGGTKLVENAAKNDENATNNA